jgi:hypothetical protein
LIPSRQLEGLDLSGAPLTPAGFQVLAKMPIDSLNVSSTDLDDAQLLLFSGNDTITTLIAPDTKITESGARAFYEARKQRLAALGKKESLRISSDLTDIADQYVD